MKKQLLLFLSTLLCFALASCGDDSGPNSSPVNPTPTPTPTPSTPTVAVSGVSVNKTTVSMMEATSEDITATVSPADATNKSVTWKSDDNAVAIVSNGKITAVGPGMTTVTVTTADGNKTATVKVTVTIDEIGRQKTALLALYNATGGESWTKKDGWNTDAELKDWYGIKLDGNHVTEVKLPNNNLQGSIPASFGEVMAITRSADEADTRAEDDGSPVTRTEGDAVNLVYLQVLDLSGNGLTGEIPASLGNLTALTTLKLDHNKLTGNLPKELVALTKLTTLTIAHNELDGKIPEEVLESTVWKKIIDKTDLTQDNGKKLDKGTVNVTSVKLDQTALAMKVGDTITLTATVAPKDATDKAVTWSSSDTKIATVDARGKVTAVASGTATITVTTKDGSKKASCTLNVEVPVVAVSGVTLNKTTLELKVGVSETLLATVAPDNATNKEVTWKSNRKWVATVDENGKVTAVAGGSATITVTTNDGKKIATCEVTVTVPVTGVTLDKTSISLETGQTETLRATVAPNNASVKDVTWESSDSTVATVTASGEVKAVKAGKATITVTTKDGEKTATCSVTVTAPVAVASVSLNKSSMSLTVGDSETLVATVAPDNAKNKNISWKSSNISVATVTNGVVTAVAAGSATITVTTADGNKTATCAVTVSAPATPPSGGGGGGGGTPPTPTTVPVTGVSLNKTSTSLTVGNTETLTATVNPSDATDKSVSWSSDKTSVATVDTSGKVTAVSAGSATITVTTADGGKTASCTVTVTAATVPVTGVSLNRSSITIESGSTTQLIATVNPSGSTNKALTWASDNPKVTVSDTGLVTAGSVPCSAVITVKTVDGNFTATCTVTVVVASSASGTTSEDVSSSEQDW